MTRSPSSQLARDWRDRLGRFDQSDLTVAEFCRREGYSPASFYQWRRKLRNRPASGKPAFLPVELTQHDVAPLAQAPLRIELPGGAVVTLDADAAQQRDLISALVQATSGSAACNQAEA